MKAGLLFLAMSCLLLPWPAFASESPPTDCKQYQGTSRHETCEHAKQYGFSFKAAALIEGLAEQTYALELCGAKSDHAALRHLEAILASSPKFQELYRAHLTMLRQRCVYDPSGWVAGA